MGEFVAAAAALAAHWFGWLVEALEGPIDEELIDEDLGFVPPEVAAAKAERE